MYGCMHVNEHTHVNMCSKCRHIGLCMNASDASMHAACRDQQNVCVKELDCFVDHAVTCFIGPCMQARHSRVNNALAQAGRDAGYASLP